MTQYIHILIDKHGFSVCPWWANRQSVFILYNIMTHAVEMALYSASMYVFPIIVLDDNGWTDKLGNMYFNVKIYNTLT